MDLVLPLRDVGRADLAVAGGKGANLGELVRAGFAVPDGFVITTAAYARAVAGIPPRRRRMPRPRATPCRTCRSPTTLRDAILAAYERLGARSRRRPLERHRRGPARRRLRRSAGDVPERPRRSTSCSTRCGGAGRRCGRIARSRTERSASIPTTTSQIAVVVQVLVPADIAGVMFTADPVTGSATAS